MLHRIANDLTLPVRQKKRLAVTGSGFGIDIVPLEMLARAATRKEPGSALLYQAEGLLLGNVEGVSGTEN